MFYYNYGLFHSEDYRKRYKNNLVKEMPRIPTVKSYVDFRAFSEAGRNLAELHLGYEKAPLYRAKVEMKGQILNRPEDLSSHNDSNDQSLFRVEKMKYGKKGSGKDLSTLHYNSRITISGIPSEAYDYVVNGKAALDWVVERQCVKTDKDSGIVNDANDWAVETMHNPRYPLELFLRVITVSLETQKIVCGLPSLDILDEQYK